MSVVVWTDLSGRVPHRHVGKNGVLLLGSLGGLMNSTLTQNARDVASIHALGGIFPILITPMTK